MLNLHKQDVHGSESNLYGAEVLTDIFTCFSSDYFGQMVMIDYAGVVFLALKWPDDPLK